jgi:subtilase family serine protease
MLLLFRKGLRQLAAFAAAAGLFAVAPSLATASGQSQRPVCPGSLVGAAQCHAHVVTDRSGRPLATSAPAGYGPAQFHGAYNLPSTASRAQTIAIVDAYDDPTAEKDLGVYSSTYGLPACTTANGCFRKVNQNGVQGSYPQKNAGWALEIALDVETAHQICQNCKILLVEASSNSFANLAAAVDTAARLGATQISNSYGGSEFSAEVNDASFDHPGIAITASSGDNGYGVEYPAASPYVVAVGGTRLDVVSLGSNSYAYGSESVWSGSGSGCSAYLAAKTWQTSDSSWAATGCGSRRGVADVAADADPNTGAAVYDSTRYQGRSGWFKVGGTSLSAPLIAGVYALAGDGGGVQYPASLPYGTRAGLNDVTSGSNGNCATIMCSAAAGYDGPTGVGTPNGTGSF